VINRLRKCFGKPTRKSLAAFGLSGLSGFLYFASFPPLGGSNLAYVALVPFLWALRLYPQAACRLGYFAGLVAWIPSLWFLSPVTIPGLLCLAFYCALYWVPVGWLWGGFLQTWAPDKPMRAVRLVVGGSAWWALMEIVRGSFLTGFPWNPLGVSQWENYGLIQLASLGGTAAVSFVLVTLNLGVGVSLLSLVETVGKRLPRRAHPELYIPILLLAVSFTWGIKEIGKGQRVPTESIRVGLIQPNIGIKWDDNRIYENYRIIWGLSDVVLSLKPDVVIWPETALPEFYGAPQAELMFEDLRKHGVPMLIGTLETEMVEEEGMEPKQLYWNSSMLLLPDGEVAATYRKRHLVMFGEYIPFAKAFPFLRSLTPFPEDVTPGVEPGILELPGKEIRLGMLICFEDLMPQLARDLVKGGADVFVNQTNDAWFDPYWGSKGHLANAVFRSVEFRRPTVRATNTGVSGWINSVGMVKGKMINEESNTVRYRGASPFEIQVPKEPVLTFYARYPFSFPWICIILSALIVTKSGRGKACFFHRRKG
jgi:apolipoprotein N-acyltransferase